MGSLAIFKNSYFKNTESENKEKYVYGWGLGGHREIKKGWKQNNVTLITWNGGTHI